MDTTIHYESAVILSFPRKRGRPRKSISSKDSGTPELIAKKQRGETTETIDLCLQRSLITNEQHWCGIHLRWLYTLRYGTASIRAIDPSHFGGLEIKTTEDPLWRKDREKEFSDAVNILAGSGYARIILSACIYDECPAFLKGGINTTNARRYATAWLENFREGLSILAELWEKRP